MPKKLEKYKYGKPVTEKDESGHISGVLAVKSVFPSIARSVHGDHKRYFETYMKPYPGYYFTGDGASRDDDGYYWIRGRVDGESFYFNEKPFLNGCIF